MARVKSKKVLCDKKFRPISGLVSWWKGRQFYFATHDCAYDERSTASADLEFRKSWKVVGQNLRGTPDSLGQKDQMSLEKTFTFDDSSLQDSIESMDSITASYWEQVDELSQATAPASNTAYKPDFLIEHLGFLSSQTQPRKVEIVLQKGVIFLSQPSRNHSLSTATSI